MGPAKYLPLIADPVTDISKKLVEQIEACPTIGVMSSDERAVFHLGLSALSKPKNMRGNLINIMKKIEKRGEKSVPQFRFSLDSNQLQIARKYEDGDFQRFGVIVRDGIASAEARICERNIYTADEVDLYELAPNIAKAVNRCHNDGKIILAILGPARMNVAASKKILELCHVAVDQLSQNRANEFAVLTGGYKGEQDGVYGVTRAGYDVTKNRKIESFLIMPKVGETDSHVNVHVKNFVGEMWGDDSKALVAACDCAIVFKPHGFWTEMEILNLEKQNKPYVISNISDGDDTIRRSIDNLIAHPSLSLDNIKKLYNRSISVDTETEEVSLQKYSSGFDHDLKKWRLL